MTLCWKCGATLASDPKSWVYEPKPSFCEAGVIELVHEISAGSLVAVDEAFQILAHEIRSSLPGKRRNYGQIFGSDHYKHIRRERMAPTFTSMLQQSQAIGVSLNQILSDPIGAAKAAGELALSGPIAMKTPVSRVSQERLQEIEFRLINDADSATQADIASFRSLAKDFDVLPGTIEYHFNELSKAYKAKRKNQLAMHMALEQQKLREALDAGLLEQYRAKRIRSIDELSRRLSEATGCGISVARRAIFFRLNVKPWHCSN